MIHRIIRGYANIKPPVGPTSAPGPLLKLENTGNPAVPSKIYPNIEIRPYFKFCSAPHKNIAAKDNVNGTGENGTGIDIMENTHIIAQNRAQITISRTFITIARI